MADKLTIRIKADEATNQTVSRFAVDEKGQVTIHNDASAALNVTFSGASPLCQGNSPQQPIDIPAKSDRKFQVCNDTGGLEFKYTATVVGAEPEDPILIIERVVPAGGSETNPSWWVEKLPGIAGGLVLGLVLGYLVARKMRARK